MQLIVNTPLEIANCQFKDLRENSLLTDRPKETHAREIQINLHGGPAVVKNVKFGQFNPKRDLHPLYPVKYVVDDPNAPIAPIDPSNPSPTPKHKKRHIKNNLKDCVQQLERTKQIIDGELV